MRKIVSALLCTLALVLLPAGHACSASGKFVGEVVAKWLANGRDMELTESFSYVDAHGAPWTVPKGAVVDGASIPRALWSIVGAPFSGKYRKASVVHDYFCQQMSRPWKDVHQVFYEASLSEGNTVSHAKLMYGAVYAWGPRWEVVDGKPVRTRDVSRPPTGSEFLELANWIEAGDRSLTDISNFIDNRFTRTGPASDKRVALVIGNSNYAHTRGLPNARNDAHAMADFLKGVGFQVTERHDANYRELREVFREFGSASSSADVAVVYFAGHGLEVAGENFVVPVDAKLATSSDLEYEAIALTSILDLVRAQRKLNLVIIDACRNNPLAEKMALREGARRSVQKGLARVEPKGDMLIAFAANAGTVAQDGTGFNSPFVEALIEHIGKPGLDIRLALGGVRDAVMAATGNAQEPVIYGALGGQTISLVPAVQATNGTQTNIVVREQDARAAWDGVKNSCSATDLKLFTARYKDTFFGDLGAKRLSEIDQRSICVEPRQATLDDKLIRSVQTELKRLGCFGGPINGSWGPESIAGLKSYIYHAKLQHSSSEPNAEVLAEMLRGKGRVCPLVCKSGEQQSGDRCVRQAGPGSPSDAAGSAMPKVAVGDCSSVRRACMQLRSQCLRVCREKLGDGAFGSCDGCLSSFSTCVSKGSSGACQ
jgi:hypothetical protein